MKEIDITFVCEELDLDEQTVLSWIECHLIEPVNLEGPLFDEEDFSRIRLIADLSKTYNTNEEILEIILNLVDQVHALTAELKKVKASNK